MYKIEIKPHGYNNGITYSWDSHDMLQLTFTDNEGEVVTKLDIPAYMAIIETLEEALHYRPKSQMEE